VCSRVKEAGNGTGKKCNASNAEEGQNSIQKEGKCLLKLILKRNPRVSFIKKNDT
jgi:hypothetical protein